MSEKKFSKTVLLTGAAGFVGSNLLVYLFNKYPDYYFLVLDALTYAGDIKNIPNEIQESGRFEFWYGDVRNSKLVDELVKRSDFVIHLAAETHVTRSIYDNLRFFETDVIGTQVVANAVSQYKDKVDRFIHISTSEVYGTALTDKMNEDHSLIPRSPYAAAKAGADRLVQSYFLTYKTPTVIVRPFNMYGPRQHLEKVVPRFITSHILNEQLTVHGDGSERRDFIHVLDTANAIDLIMHAPKEKVIGEVFNVGSESDTSVKEIADVVLKEAGQTESVIVSIGNRPGQVLRHTADAQKIKNVLGWEQKINFTDGLKTTIDWYKNNREWWEHKRWMRHVPIITASGKIELH
jgi:dTDP-glucose 4,6-dehydratase